MRRLIVSLALALVLVVGLAVPALALNYAEVDVTATPEYISISVDYEGSPAPYDFGPVAESATPSTTTSFFTITNASSVITNNTVSVTTEIWDGGLDWAHNDSGEPGIAAAALLANKGGTWGVNDVIVKYDEPLILAAEQAKETPWSFGLMLLAPTEFSDGVAKTITVKITAGKHGGP